MRWGAAPSLGALPARAVWEAQQVTPGQMVEVGLKGGVLLTSQPWLHTLLQTCGLRGGGTALALEGAGALHWLWKGRGHCIGSEGGGALHWLWRGRSTALALEGEGHCIGSGGGGGTALALDGVALHPVSRADKSPRGWCGGSGPWRTGEVQVRPLPPRCGVGHLRQRE